MMHETRCAIVQAEPVQNCQTFKLAVPSLTHSVDRLREKDGCVPKVAIVLKVTGTLPRW